MENILDLQIKKIAELLITEQERLGLTQLEMSVRLDVSEREYQNMIYAIHGTQGYSMETLNKIFENTNIECCDVFR